MKKSRPGKSSRNNYFAPLHPPKEREQDSKEREYVDLSKETLNEKRKKNKRGGDPRRTPAQERTGRPDAAGTGAAFGAIPN